jgi:PilZ domain
MPGLYVDKNKAISQSGIPLVAEFPLSKPNCFMFSLGIAAEEIMGFAMDEDFADIVQKVDSYLRIHPNISLQLLVNKLNIPEPVIDAALHAIEGISYQEFQEEKRLAQAFKQLGALSPAANGPYDIVRARQRLAIPRAKVQYGIPGFWRRKIEYSHPCPLVDLSCEGLALLTDSALKPNRRISTLLKFPGAEEILHVEGRIAYVLATGIAGYRYRIGVQFLPFSGQKGCNDLKSLDVLAKIEKTYTPQKPASELNG